MVTTLLWTLHKATSSTALCSQLCLTLHMHLPDLTLAVKNAVVNTSDNNLYPYLVAKNEHFNVTIHLTCVRCLPQDKANQALEMPLHSHQAQRECRQLFLSQISKLYIPKRMREKAQPLLYMKCWQRAGIFPVNTTAWCHRKSDKAGQRTLMSSHACTLAVLLGSLWASTLVKHGQKQAVCNRANKNWKLTWLLSFCTPKHIQKLQGGAALHGHISMGVLAPLPSAASHKHPLK